MASNLPPLTGDITKDLPPLSGDITKDLGAPAVEAAPPATAERPGFWGRVLDPSYGPKPVTPKGLPEIPSPVTVGGKALNYATEPIRVGGEMAGFPKTGRFVANAAPAAALAALTGGASLPAQSVLQMGLTHAMQEGGMEEKRPAGPVDTSVLLSGALPFVAAGIGRLMRGLGRTGQRLLPSQFESAQQTAQDRLGQMVEGARPPAGAVAAMGKAAEQEGAASIPVGTTVGYASRLKFPAQSADPGMVAVRTTVDNIQAATKGGTTMPLAELEAIRQDIGPLLRRGTAPDQLRALYGTLITDLDRAAAVGTPGAQYARQAAALFKQDLGANLIQKLASQATQQRVISGSTVPALNVSKFAELTTKNQEQLVKYLGPEVMPALQQFVYDFRGLPPTVAFTGLNRALMGGLGGAGWLVGGGLVPALSAALVPEILVNAALVGRNPAAMSGALNALTSGARAGYMATPTDLVGGGTRGR